MLYDDLEFNVDATQNTTIIDIEGLNRYFATHPGIDEIIIRNDPNNQAPEIFLDISSTKAGAELEFLTKVRLEGGNAKLKIVSKFERVVYTEEQFQNFSGIDQEQKQPLALDKQTKCLSAIDKLLENSSGSKTIILDAMLSRLWIREAADISFIPESKILALKEYCMRSAHTSEFKAQVSLILLEVFRHENNIAVWFVDKLESFNDLSVIASAIQVIITSGKTEYLDQKREFVESMLLLHMNTAPDSLILNSLQFLYKAIKPSKPLDIRLLEHLPEFIKKNHTEIMLYASKLLSISSGEGHDLSDMGVLGSVITKINSVAGTNNSKVLENLFDVIKPNITSFSPSMHKAIEQSFTHLNSEGKQKYVELVKQFVSDSYKFDVATITELKKAIISEKKDVMRKGLSDLLFDIASNNTEYIGTISDFFFKCLQDGKGIFADSFSTKVILDEIIRFVEYFHMDVPVAALRKLNEIAVDKLRPVGICLKAIELLKLSLIYSKEIPVRPVIQRLSEFYDSGVADMIASEIMNYLELRFLHEVDNIEEFVLGLKAIKPFSGVAQGLLKSEILKEALMNQESLEHIRDLQELIIYALSGGVEGNKAPLIFRFAESLEYGQAGNLERNLDLLQMLVSMDSRFTDNLFDGLINILKAGHGNAGSISLQRIIGKAVALLRVATETNHILPYDEIKRVIQNLHISYQESYEADIKIIFDYLADQQAAFGAEDGDCDKLFDRLYTQNLGYGISFFNKADQLSELRIMHDAVLDRFQDCSVLFPDSGPIQDWDVGQVGSWASHIASLELSVQKPEIIKQTLPEILAVMMIANKIDTGNLLR